MTAGEYCNREVTIVEPDSTITEAARLMRQHHVGTLVVVAQAAGDNRPIGIVTDRDLVIEILAQDVAVDSVTIRDVMSKEPVHVGEGETLLNTIKLMQSRGVRRILVVNDEGSLQGLMSADDVIELLAEAMDSLTRVVRRELTNEQRAHP